MSVELESAEKVPASDPGDTSREPVEVIFTLSPGHSGSTLLDQLISGHSEIVSGGEFRPVDHHVEKGCSCGVQDVCACPFWCQIAKVLQSHRADLKNIEAHETDCFDFACYNHTLLRAMLRVSNCRTVMDSSKRRKGRLHNYLARPKLFKVWIVILARDPLQTVFSHRKRDRSVLKYCAKMNRRYFHQLRFAPIASCFVRYETLVAEPEAELKRITKALNLEFEPLNQLMPENNIYHHLGGNALIGDTLGNIRLDDAWKRGFTVREKLLVALATLPSRLFIRLTQFIISARSRFGR